MSAIDEAVQAVRDGMPQREAARKFGVGRTAIQYHLYRDSDYTPQVIATSVLYDAEGNVKLEWVKSAEDKAKQDQVFHAASKALASKLPRERAVKAPKSVNDDLMAIYPIGDHHFGMLAWSDETGSEDYDLGRAESLLCRAMDHLVSVTPHCREAAVLVLGDILHYDGYAPVTPENKNLLDADSRFPKMVKVALRSIRYLIRSALAKHERIRLVFEIGNHDPSSAIFLMECFAQLFEEEPRIEVDQSPRQFHCFTFGKNMIGTHHGHGVKMDKLALLFASDWPIEWGQTVHRTIHTGHVHHDHVKEFVGAKVESHGILAPQDAYAANNGYRAKQSMKALVIHREHGEVARHTVNPSMLDAS